MKVRVSKVIEINNTDLDSVPLMKFSRFSGMNPAYLCRVRKNQVVISEKMYEKILQHLTKYSQ
jgi:hypothetical protein